MLGSTIRGREGLITRRHEQLEKPDMREMCCGKTMVQAEIRKSRSSGTISIEYDEVEQTREKTILTNVVKI